MEFYSLPPATQATTPALTSRRRKKKEENREKTNFIHKKLAKQISFSAYHYITLFLSNDLQIFKITSMGG